MPKPIEAMPSVIMKGETPKSGHADAVDDADGDPGADAGQHAERRSHSTTASG